MSDSLIDIKELGRRLNIKPGTLYNWVYQKRLTPLRFGRSLRFDYEDVIQNQRRSITMGSAGHGRRS